MSGIIPGDNPPSPVPTSGVGRGKCGFPDVRRATGDERLGAMLREMREKDGRGLKQPASFAGVWPSTLSDYEAGRSMPSVPVLARLCRFYGVRSDNLMRHLGEKYTAA